MYHHQLYLLFELMSLRSYIFFRREWPTQNETRMDRTRYEMRRQEVN